MPHTCHLPGCKASCPPAWLYCRPHWRMVPRDVQLRVYATVRARGKRVDETWAPWWRATADAEAAVLRKLYPEAEDRIARRYAKEIAFADNLEAKAEA